MFSPKTRGIQFQFGWEKIQNAQKRLSSSPSGGLFYKFLVAWTVFLAGGRPRGQNRKLQTWPRQGIRIRGNHPRPGAPRWMFPGRYFTQALLPGGASPEKFSCPIKGPSDRPFPGSCPPLWPKTGRQTKAASLKGDRTTHWSMGWPMGQAGAGKAYGPPGPGAAQNR